MKKILSKHFWVDQDIEKFIGGLLRYGVIVSSVIVLAGGTGYLIQNGYAHIPDYSIFQGIKKMPATGTNVHTGVLMPDMKQIIRLGVIALIATPVIRIAFSLVAFLIEKDRMYVVITFIVLLVMIYSIFGGIKA